MENPNASYPTLDIFDTPTEDDHRGLEEAPWYEARASYHEAEVPIRIWKAADGAGEHASVSELSLDG